MSPLTKFLLVMIVILSIAHYIFSIEIPSWVNWILFIIILWGLGDGLEAWYDRIVKIEQSINEISERLEETENRLVSLENSSDYEDDDDFYDDDLYDDELDYDGKDDYSDGDESINAESQSISNKIQFKCPNCQTKYSALAEQAGKEGTCKKCRAKIVVPNLQLNYSENLTTCSKCNQSICVSAKFCTNCGNPQN